MSFDVIISFLNFCFIFKFIPRSVLQLSDVLYVRAVARGDLSVYILQLFHIFPPFKSEEEIQYIHFSFIFVLDSFRLIQLLRKIFTETAFRIFLAVIR